MKKKFNIDKEISIHDMRKKNREKEGKKKKVILGAVAVFVALCIILGEEFIATVGLFVFLAGLLGFFVLTSVFY